MRTTYQNIKYEIRGVFAHALFVPKTPNVMGFSGSVNSTTKNPGFLDFGFCQCKWAYSEISKLCFQNMLDTFSLCWENRSDNPNL